MQATRTIATLEMRTRRLEDEARSIETGLAEEARPTPRQ